MGTVECAWNTDYVANKHTRRTASYGPDVDHIHGPVVAGRFYPADPEELRDAVRRQLETARRHDTSGRLVGLIVPHAALQYSGPVAATAYRLLAETNAHEIVMIGPSHFTRFDGLASLEADGWRTPLGVVPVTAVATDSLIRSRRDPYRREHCLEIQLPFLQEILDHPVVMPLLFGRVDPVVAGEAVAPLLEPGRFLLVSSDLSHYLPHSVAVQVDRTTAEAIVDLRPNALGRDTACGRVPIQCAIAIARRRSWRIELLDLRTSADTAGSPDRVVGYGAFAIIDPNPV